MSSRKNPSPIWTYFTVLDNTIKAAQCDLCGLKLSFKGTISNLKAHLSRKHLTIDLKLDKPNQPALNKSIENPISAEVPTNFLETESNINPDDPSSSHQDGISLENRSLADVTPTTSTCSNNLLATTSTKSKQSNILTYIPKKVSVSQKKKIDKTLLKLFTKDYQPFSVVEDVGFKEFVSALNPSYELPSRKVISNNFISAAFENCKLQVKEKVIKAPTICLTTDCWSSSANESYIALTSHHISEDFTLESNLLDCDQIEGSHTSEHLAETIKNITAEYNIPGEKILLVVSDNASNIVGAVTNELKWKHFGCYAHTINLIVQRGLDTVQGLRDKGKSIVSFFKRSNLATERLVKYQKDSGVSQPKKVIQDVLTRWNSTYYMFRRLVSLEDGIKASLALSEKSELNLTSIEWKVCSELVKALEPFESVTRQMSGEGYLTGSQVIVLTVGLQNVCNELLKKPFHGTVLDMVKVLQDGIATRFKDIEFSQTLAISTFLDPRFKLHPFTTEKAKAKVKTTVEQLVTREISMKKQEAPNDETVDEPKSKKNKEDEEKELSVWHYFDSIMEKQPESNSTSSAIVEVKRYLDERAIHRKDDPLKWWAENHRHYPNLASLAKKRLPVVATSVPCERVFSKTGVLINERRNRLKPKKVKELIFLNSNTK